MPVAPPAAWRAGRGVRVALPPPPPNPSPPCSCPPPPLPPQFGALGVGCAGAAVALYEGVRVSEIALRPLPRIVSAPLAGLLCGIIALQYPQVI